MTRQDGAVELHECQCLVHPVEAVGGAADHEGVITFKPDASCTERASAGWSSSVSLTAIRSAIPRVAPCLLAYATSTGNGDLRFHRCDLVGLRLGAQDPYFEGTAFSDPGVAVVQEVVLRLMSRAISTSTRERSKGPPEAGTSLSPCLDRLEALEAEYSQVLTRLSDPTLSKDPNELRVLSRRHKELETVVRKMHELKSAQDDVATARELAADAVGAERELGRDEQGCRRGKGRGTRDGAARSADAP